MVPYPRVLIIVFVVAAIAAPFALAEEWRLTLDPASTDVAFKIKATMHTVEGSFELESGEIRFDPETGDASGTITIDARSGDTGIGRRNRKMHANVLESERFPVITFQAERIQGDFVPEGSSSFLLKGTITIHGNQHPITMPTTIEIDGDHVKAKTSLAIPYVEWGMRDPSRWYIHIAKQVFVSVEAEGTLIPIRE